MFSPAVNLLNVFATTYKLQIDLGLLVNYFRQIRIVPFKIVYYKFEISSHLSVTFGMTMNLKSDAIRYVTILSQSADKFYLFHTVIALLLKKPQKQ